MKHYYIILIALAFGLLSANAAVTYKVRNNPQAGEFASIKEALVNCVTTSSLAERDTIDVLGVFTDSVRINKSVVIKGHGWNETILQRYTTKQTETPTNDMKSVVIINSGASAHLMNLQVRYGNSYIQGGGIRVDANVGGKVLLDRLKVTDNFSSQHSGGVAIIGSNVEVKNCYITQNRSAAVGGGGMQIVSNNSGEDCKVFVTGCTIANNITTNGTGGGLSIDGNGTYGNQKKLEVYIENSTIAFNESATTGGGVFAKGVAYAGTIAENTNTKIWMNHCTIAYNKVTTLGSGTTAVGLSLANVSGTAGIPALDIHNTIITKNEVYVDATTNKNDVNFNKSALDSVTNCIFGVTFNLTTAGTNLLNKTGKFDIVKLDTELRNEGGLVPVLPILAGSTAIDSIQTNYAPLLKDQRGFLRNNKSDVGAYEFSASNPSGIQELNHHKSRFKLVQNPVKNIIQFTNSDEISRVIIRNLNGITIYDGEYGAGVNASYLKTGVYIVQINSITYEKTSQLFIKAK